MSKIETGLRVAALTTLRDLIDSQLEQARAEMREQLVSLSEAYGVKSIEVKADGDPVASATLSDAKPKPYVLDERALIEWMADRFPTSILTKKYVEPAFLKSFLETIVFEDDMAVSTATGEILEFIGKQDGRQTLTIRFKPEGRNKVAAMFGSGSANLIDYIEQPQLEGKE